MKPNKCQNKSKEEKNDKGKDKKSPEKRNRAVGDAFAGEKKKTVSGKHTRTRKRVYGVRGRARKPEDAKRISEEPADYSPARRYIESSLGIKSYSELAPHLAKGVERVMASLRQEAQQLFFCNTNPYNI